MQKRMKNETLATLENYSLVNKIDRNGEAKTYEILVF